MEAYEIQAKAVIAAALITTKRSNPDEIDAKEHWSRSEELKRLRQITNAVYQALIDPDA